MLDYGLYLLIYFQLLALQDHFNYLKRFFLLILTSPIGSFNLFKIIVFLDG